MGRYDSIVRSSTKEAIKHIKGFIQSKRKTNEEFINIQFLNDRNISCFLYMYKDSEDVILAEGQEYTIDGFVNAEEDSSFITIHYYDNRKVKDLSNIKELHYMFYDVLRHEIEHITHFIKGEQVGNKNVYRNDGYLRDRLYFRQEHYKYYFLKTEIDANLQGTYMYAKKKKIPYKQAIDRFINDIKSRVEITEKQINELLNLMRKRSKTIGGLPNF